MLNGIIVYIFLGKSLKYILLLLFINYIIYNYNI